LLRTCDSPQQGSLDLIGQNCGKLARSACQNTDRLFDLVLTAMKNPDDLRVRAPPSKSTSPQTISARRREPLRRLLKLIRQRSAEHM